MDPSPHAPVVIGQLAGAYGVRGWLHVLSYTDPPERFLDYAPVTVAARDGTRRSARFDAGRRHANGLIAHLAGLDDRERASALRGAEVTVDAAQLPSLPVGEYYWNDLIGLAVWSVDGSSPLRLGTVASMLETGANDVMCVAPDADSCDDRERMVPYLRDRVVRSVDLSGGGVQVDWAADF